MLTRHPPRWNFHFFYKLELHLEFPGEKEIDIECIYQFTLVAHSNSHKIKAIVDFVDSDVFLGMSG